MKEQMAQSLRDSGYEVVDFGARQLNPEDDYPDFIIALFSTLLLLTTEMQHGSKLS